VNDLGLGRRRRRRLGSGRSGCSRDHRRRGVAVASLDSVSTPQTAEQIIRTAVEAFGTVDILINNAGILRDSSFHKMTLSKSMQYSMFTFGIVLRYVAGLAGDAGKSIRPNNQYFVELGLIGNFGQSNYGAAKLGVVGMTRVLAAEGQRYNIRVNAIAPAALTRMTENVVEGMWQGCLLRLSWRRRGLVGSRGLRDHREIISAGVVESPGTSSA